MAFSSPASASLRVMEDECPTYPGALKRCQDKDFKPENSTALLLLVNSKRKLVLGYCQSLEAVVPLPHGVRERWTKSEIAFIRQDTCLVFNPLSTRSPRLLPDDHCTSKKFQAPYWGLHGCRMMAFHSILHLLIPYFLHPNTHTSFSFLGHSKSFPAPGLLHQASPLPGVWLLCMCLISLRTWFIGQLVRSFLDYPI